MKSKYMSELINGLSPEKKTEYFSLRKEAVKIPELKTIITILENATDEKILNLYFSVIMQTVCSK